MCVSVARVCLCHGIFLAKTLIRKANNGVQCKVSLMGGPKQGSSQNNMLPDVRIICVGCSFAGCVVRNVVVVVRLCCGSYTFLWLKFVGVGS